MFKSKIDINEFDKNNKKVKDIEYPKAKALAKAGAKKLATKPEEKTNFHLALNYFQDDKGKSLGHFLCFGVNKKMDKHFLQIEMKSGKMDKSMTASQKEASMGEAYAKEINSKLVLCFEPDANSKIPQGKWPKILKELKAFLNGMKAVAVFNGQIVEEGDEETTEEGTETTDETVDTTTNETTTEEETTGEEDTDTTDETTTTEGDTDTTEEDTTNTEEDTTNEQDNRLLEKKRQQRAGQMKKMDQGLGQMESAVGKAPRVKLTANVEKYEQALQQLIDRANEDGVIDDQEQTEIDALTQKIEELKQAIEERGGRLTPKHREQVNTNLSKIKQELETMAEEFNL